MTDIIKRYLFIDESGDPVFYGNRKKPLVGTSGFSPTSFLLNSILMFYTIYLMAG